MGANDISVLRTWTSRQGRSNGTSSFARMRFNGSRDAKFRNAVRYTACSTFPIIKFARVYRGLGVVESSARWVFSAKGSERKEGLHVRADSTRFRAFRDSTGARRRDRWGRMRIDRRTSLRDVRFAIQDPTHGRIGGRRKERRVNVALAFVQVRWGAECERNESERGEKNGRVWQRESRAEGRRFVRRDTSIR